MTYHPHDDLPVAGPSFDGYGAAITSSIHEIEDHRTDPATLEQPGEAWCRCACGEEMESQGSAGGPEQSVGEMFVLHLEEVAADEGADCGETA